MGRPSDETTTVTGAGSFDRLMTKPEGDALIVGTASQVRMWLRVRPLDHRKRVSPWRRPAWDDGSSSTATSRVASMIPPEVVLALTLQSSLHRPANRHAVRKAEPTGLRPAARDAIGAFPGFADGQVVSAHLLILNLPLGNQPNGDAKTADGRDKRVGLNREANA